MRFTGAAGSVDPEPPILIIRNLLPSSDTSWVGEAPGTVLKFGPRSTVRGAPAVHPVPWPMDTLISAPVGAR